ncbi:predicted protein [Chaetoceros tenuissimus]|uniref:Uncharacterized protein n=1 Tax=Chaetoceros tenuissimus TaxID=426638 RepID=A0AAD3CSD5_9STRA|nr:predicted protein [Chaetoceros tenuissimus]
MKQTQARSYIKTLVTIDIINRAIRNFGNAMNERIQFKIDYGRDCYTTESKMVREFFDNEDSVVMRVGNGAIDEIVLKVNENILGLNLKIVRYSMDYQSESGMEFDSNMENDSTFTRRHTLTIGTAS